MSVRSGRVPAEGTERENQEYGSMLLVDREEQGEPVEGNLSVVGFSCLQFPPQIWQRRT